MTARPRQTCVAGLHASLNRFGVPLPDASARDAGEAPSRRRLLLSKERNLPPASGTANLPLLTDAPVHGPIIMPGTWGRGICSSPEMPRPARRTLKAAFGAPSPFSDFKREH